MRIFAAVIALAAALALSGCAAPLPEDPEEAFIVELGEFATFDEVFDEQSWVELGYIACREFDEMSADGVAAFMEEMKQDSPSEDWDSIEKGYKLVVKHLCPENASKMP
ncbi:hypothetical protein [Microbacterium sp. PA5]|uniref:hypothetical protein n=1 Tax=Microbacterium sp. PA5 TaxID=3416654 RepID=UPI003CE96AFB